MNEQRAVTKITKNVINILQEAKEKKKMQMYTQIISELGQIPQNHVPNLLQLSK